MLDLKNMYYNYLKILSFYTLPLYFFVQKDKKNIEKDPWDIYVDRCTVDENTFLNRRN